MYNKILLNKYIKRWILRPIIYFTGSLADDKGRELVLYQNDTKGYRGRLATYGNDNLNAELHIFVHLAKEGVGCDF